MRVETKIKCGDVTSPCAEAIEEGVRLHLARQTTHLKNVKVWLNSGPLSGSLLNTVLFRVDFDTGGSLILEERAESLALAFRHGLLKLSKSLDAEMRRRWIFPDSGTWGKPVKNMLKSIWNGPLRNSNGRAQS